MWPYHSVCSWLYIVYDCSEKAYIRYTSHLLLKWTRMRIKSSKLINNDIQIKLEIEGVLFELWYSHYSAVQFEVSHMQVTRCFILFVIFYFSMNQFCIVMLFLIESKFIIVNHYKYNLMKWKKWSPIHSRFKNCLHLNVLPYYVFV